MGPANRTSGRGREGAALALTGFVIIAAAGSPAVAGGCAFESQGEGRVDKVIDATSFRLSDGREVRLAGIEPVISDKLNGIAALAAIVSGRDVTLRGEDDAPDRYGRQSALGVLGRSGLSVHHR